MPTYFGTDGIRATEKEFTEDFLRKISFGIAALGGKKLVIGRDPRVSGKFIETVMSKALCEAGAKVFLAGMVPTPTLAYLTKEWNCDFGIMLSASHNPPEYNGIKLFNSEGEKVSAEIETAVGVYIDNPKKVSGKAGLVKEKDGVQDYIDYLLKEVKPDLKGMKIVLDTSNGATSDIAPKLFKAAGAEVIAFATSVSGKDINVNCGATCPEFLTAKMKETGASLGFSFDGDGDRVFCIANGKALNGDHLMYVHAKDMKKRGKLVKNAVVGTIMSNMGTEKAFERAGIKLVRTGVGDKLVFREMEKEGYNIGGEESGHLIFTDYLRTGDGCIAALLSAKLHKKSPLDKEDDIVEYPKVSDKVKCTPEGVKRFNESKEIQNYLAKINGKCRTVVRPSGTEPIIRILVEGEDAAEIKAVAANLKRYIEQRL